MNYFVTADYHLGHGDIIDLVPRPFKSLEEMNEKIIKAHNSRVKPDDIVFHIGDFCFYGKSDSGMKVKAKEWLSQLNGQIILLRGNHDSNNNVKTIIESLEVGFGGYRIFLTHNPDDYNPKFKINLVGHVHGNWHLRKIEDSILFNVGIDVNNYMPLKLSEVLYKIEKFKKECLTFD